MTAIIPSPSRVLRSRMRSAPIPKIPTENNLDILRLIFASMVVLAHCHDLTLNPSLSWIEWCVNSTLAVKCFFVISGFLVFMSYEKSKSLEQYFSKRIRRIYPAYVVVILTCAFLGGFVSDLSINQYFGPGFLKYLFSNLLFLNFLYPSLPGVFDHQLVTAVNGALWTIKIEVSFYFAVPVICWLMRKFGINTVTAVLYILSFSYFSLFDHLYTESGREIWNLLNKQLPGQLNYFLCGAFLYYNFPVIKKNSIKTLILGVFCFVVGSIFDSELIYPVGVSILVIAIAFGPKLGNAARYGDFSYGIYIWHFPVIQTIVFLSFFEKSPNFAVLLAYGIAILFAFASWHLIEKPWLFRSSHYINEESTRRAESQ